jgi:myosin-crossreactive antigen
LRTTIIIEIFGDTLYYLVTKEIDTGDGKEIYRKIMLHLNGQRAKYADGAREIYNELANSTEV